MILKNTLAILNKSILFTEVLQMLCLYDEKRNSFTATALPQICQEISFEMLKKELEKFKEFNKIPLNKLLENLNGQTETTSTGVTVENDKFIRFRAIYSQIQPVLQFIYRKCVELRFTVDFDENLNLNFDENLFPVVSRLPRDYYETDDLSSLKVLFGWFSISDQTNLAKNLTTNMILMLLERILQLLKTFEYILNKLKQIQSPESREPNIIYNFFH
ncbi:Uncharacterized protein CTYZ_00000074 [Cryptosporidium tyzzeri]|nr:Uncharacterized protein CTYZ_00000074 [Cryptosporidium tyzzeri]